MLHRLAQGTILSATIFGLASCSSSPSSTPTAPISPTQASPYASSSVLLLANSAIYTYPLSGNGTATSINVTPSATLTPPAGSTFTAMAQDAAGNLYVGAYQQANPFALEILVYSAGSTGSATPTRTITGTATTLSLQGVSLPQDQLYGILALAVDSTGAIYATYGYSIVVFAADANGNVAPTRVLAGASTGITYATQLAVDSTNNLYVSNTSADASIGEIYEFASAATGNVAPIRTYAGANLSFPWGLDVDSGDNLYVSDTSGGGNGYVYASPSTTPTRTFTNTNGTSSGSYESWWGMREDKQGYTFVAVQNADNNTAIQAFPPTASGQTGCVTFQTTLTFNRAPQILLK